MSKTPETTTHQGVWTSSKHAEPGTWVASAVKGRPANGANEYRQVAEATIERGGIRRLVFTDGTASTMGNATKMFVAPGELVTKTKPKANAKAIGDALDGAFLFPEGPDRVAAAKTEHKLLKLWISDGEKPPRPATPNLDALNEAYAAGETAAMRNRRLKGKKAPTQAAPAPIVGKGQVVVQLRNPAHGEVVAAAVKGTSSEVSGQWLVIGTGDAQAVFDALVTATEGASQFTTRLLVLAQLLVRSVVPKVTDARNGLVPRLVNHLTTAGTPWSVTWATDATPVFTIDGQTYTTTRAAAEAVAVPTKAVSVAA